MFLIPGHISIDKTCLSKLVRPVILKTKSMCEMHNTGHFHINPEFSKKFAVGTFSSLVLSILQFFFKRQENNDSKCLKKEFKETKRADRNRYVGRQTRPWPTK